MTAEPQLQFVQAAGLELAVWNWRGAGPPLLFAHATSLHGRCWDAVIRLLPRGRAIAPDQRGHGRSPKPAPPYRWRAFGADLAALAETLGLRGAIGIGHSMGGYAIAAAAAERPETFASLLLIDPTIFPAGRYGKPGGDPSHTLRRRNRWQSPEEMFERFRHRAPFAHWQPEALRDYCDYGVLPDDDGFVLACPPAVEHSIYTLSREPAANLDRDLPAIRQPVTVLRAGIAPQPGVFDLSASPTDPALAARLPDARDILLEGRSHYIPMEAPQAVADEITRMLRGPGRRDGRDLL